jgi:hypothetical protein
MEVRNVFTMIAYWGIKGLRVMAECIRCVQEAMNNCFRIYDGEVVVLIQGFGRWFIPWKGGRAAGTRALERWR